MRSSDRDKIPPPTKNVLFRTSQHLESETSQAEDEPQCPNLVCLSTSRVSSQLLLKALRQAFRAVLLPLLPLLLHLSIFPLTFSLFGDPARQGRLFQVRSQHHQGPQIHPLNKELQREFVEKKNIRHYETLYLRDQGIISVC